MKKRLRITLVPARSMVQLGSTGTGRSWAVQLSAEKSTHTMLIASHEPRFRFLDTEQGSPANQLAKLKKQTSKWAATHAYNQRVKRRSKPSSKPSAEIFIPGNAEGNYLRGRRGAPSETTDYGTVDTSELKEKLDKMSPAQVEQLGKTIMANSSGKINLKS